VVNLRFLHPWVLWFLLLLPLILYVFVLEERFKRKAVEKFAKIQTKFFCFSLKQWAAKTFKVLAVALAIIAFAGLQVKMEVEHPLKKGVGFVFVIDVSKSMNARDIVPVGFETRSRLEQAICEIKRFIVYLPKGYRIGLEAFAGDVVRVLGLTDDYAAILASLDAVGPYLVSWQGTNLETAIEEAMEMFDKEAKSKIIVLLSDGEKEGKSFSSSYGGAYGGGGGGEIKSFSSLYGEALKNNIRIYTIGIGSPEEVLIPDSTNSSGWLEDSSGNLVSTKMDEEQLVEIASNTDGKYFHFSQEGKLMEVLKKVLEKEGESVKEKRKEYVDISYYFLLAAILSVLGGEVLVRRQR